MNPLIRNTMPVLQKMIMVPPSNPKTILDQKIIKFIVLVNDESVVVKANNLALDTPANVDRFVIWYKEPDLTNIKKENPSLPNDLSLVTAFTLSEINKVADVIMNSETIDYVRIDSAYTKAGLPEFNK